MFIPNCVCVLTNKRYKTYRMGFSFCSLGLAQRVGLGGAEVKNLSVGICDGAQLTTFILILYITVNIFFSHVRMGLPALNQYHTELRVTNYLICNWSFNQLLSFSNHAKFVENQKRKRQLATQYLLQVDSCKFGLFSESQRKWQLALKAAIFIL